MHHRGCQTLSLFAVLAVVLILAGCTFKISEPAAGVYVKNPVQAEVDWTPDYRANTFKVVIDPATSNVDVTRELAISSVSSGGYAAKGTLPGLPAGMHTLKVSGDLYIWYTGGYSHTSSQSSFEVLVLKK
jgi:NADH:ubiquinone oxidoreductase subunit 2 (subunit N)